MTESLKLCNHGILHKKTEYIYQCLYCKEEFESDISIPPFNQNGSITTE